MKEYNFKEIEKKWKDFFASQKFVENPSKKNFYLLEMFPYPSGALHMGHMRNYTIGDTYKRFLEMNGYNVIYPMGYDAFGLPAENAAIKSGVDPRKWTFSNIEKMMSQQKQMGLSYQWDRVIITCEENYYRWNQWFFLKFLEKGLAYRKKAPINWCPSCKTVLANEQVHNGKCWRCEAEVEIKSLEQWFLKITSYAEELLNDIETLDWPERVKLQQKNWLGKSEGVRIKFPLETEGFVEVFTTRPDTLWGATFMAISCNHPVLEKIAENQKEEIENLKKIALTQSEEEKEKHGVKLSVKAINPVTGEKIPIFAANFVLMEYGTGAIMCVPAHDKRDFAFAKKYNLPIRVVINPPGENLNPEKMQEAYVEEGIIVNSGKFNGKNSKEAISEIIDFLEEKKLGRREIQWKLRDWLISRQRYWGTPIPVVYCEKCGIVPVPENELPVKLPQNVRFTGSGNPLEKCQEFVNTKCPKCSSPAKRETDTLDTFFDSSWYFLRYLDSKNENLPFDPKIANKYMPVDQYIGGIEHATMHLIYARFFTKVLRDLGLLKTGEPFKKLLCQGMVIKDGAKMSKSKGNVVSVDDILENYGADAGRLFILFASPPERDLEWSDEGIKGCVRFLNRFWQLVQFAFSDEKGEKLPQKEKDLLKLNLSRTIKKVKDDLKNFQFNTAIAAIQELLNFVQKLKNLYSNFEELKETSKILVQLLHPFAPFITMELAQSFEIPLNKFPEYDEKIIKSSQKEVVIQVNGKLRGKIFANESESKDDLLKKALEKEKIKKFITGEIVKTVYIPGKILNIVVKY